MKNIQYTCLLSLIAVGFAAPSLQTFAEANSDEFNVLCKATLENSQDRVIFTQKMDFTGTAVGVPTIILENLSEKGEQNKIDLNPVRYSSKNNYARIQNNVVKFAAFSVVNDGIEEIISVEYAGLNNASNYISVSRLVNEAYIRQSAKGKAVLCTVK